MSGVPDLQQVLRVGLSESIPSYSPVLISIFLQHNVTGTTKVSDIAIYNISALQNFGTSRFLTFRRRFIFGVG